jgi:hypothetical protein
MFASLIISLLSIYKSDVTYCTSNIQINKIFNLQLNTMETQTANTNISTILILSVK